MWKGGEMGRLRSHRGVGSRESGVARWTRSKRGDDGRGVVFRQGNAMRGVGRRYA